MNKLWLILSSLALIPVSGHAQMIKSEVTASNGVVIDRNADDFAQRFEYSAPTIDFKSQNGATGAAFVAKIRKGGALGNLNIQGFIMYSGEWRMFKSAVFRGGDAVNYTRTSGNVGSCRYGCSLTENFSIDLTPAQIAKYAENGQIAVQIRSEATDTAILNIPVSYINAVNEVAK